MVDKDLLQEIEPADEEQEAEEPLNELDLEDLPEENVNTLDANLNSLISSKENPEPEVKELEEQMTEETTLAENKAMVADGQIKVLTKEQMDKLPLTDWFSTAEIGEINNYILSATAGSSLNSLLVLTDVPIEKAKVYVAVYRITNSVKNYVQTGIKEKIVYMLDKNEKTYNNVYAKLLTIQNNTASFRRQRLMESLINELRDPACLKEMNEFIDLFFLFSEKQVKYELDKITGINLENDSGKQLYKEINSG